MVSRSTSCLPATKPVDGGQGSVMTVASLPFRRKQARPYQVISIGVANGSADEGEACEFALASPSSPPYARRASSWRKGLDVTRSARRGATDGSTDLPRKGPARATITIYR